jgi:hypothetical protein
MFLAKCEQCGRFIGYNNYVTYTLHGRSQDVDPPDPVFECLKCWDEQEERWRRLTYNISWIKPKIVRNGKTEAYYYVKSTKRSSHDTKM